MRMLFVVNKGCTKMKIKEKVPQKFTYSTERCNSLSFIYIRLLSNQCKMHTFSNHRAFYCVVIYSFTISLHPRHLRYIIYAFLGRPNTPRDAEIINNKNDDAFSSYYCLFMATCILRADCTFEIKLTVLAVTQCK